jgi:hypothetical protein
MEIKMGIAMGDNGGAFLMSLTLRVPHPFTLFVKGT